MERGNLRIESVGFPSPLNFHAFLKAKFALLYQSSKSSTNKKPANYRKKRSFLQLCAFAKKNAVSLAKPRLQRRFGTEKAVTYQTPQAKAPEFSLR